MYYKTYRNGCKKLIFWTLRVDPECLFTFLRRQGRVCDRQRQNKRGRTRPPPFIAAFRAFG